MQEEEGIITGITCGTICGIGVRLGSLLNASDTLVIDENVVDLTDLNVVETDNYILALNPTDYEGYQFKLNVYSYAVSDEIAALITEENENSIESNLPLADTDAVIESLADWVEANSITGANINMDLYDACTSASLADRERFATEENENSFYNLQIS